MTNTMCKRKAWGRALDKYSPSKCTLLSPVNVIYAHVKQKDLLNDRFFEGLLLATMLSEENYYLNSISIVHEMHNDPDALIKIFRNSWLKFNLIKRLINVYYLAKGSYGKVFEATDKYSDRKLAIKNIIPSDSSEYDHLYSLWKIFMERNILLTANDSPYMTRLFATFQDVNKKSFWIFMEYCFCTLSDLYSSLIQRDVRETCTSFLRGLPVISENAAASLEQIGMNYETLSFVYFFQLLSALHYLADRHIVHADIKSDNVLIATNGQAKLSDLGAAQRFRWIDKRSALHIIKDIDNMKKEVEEYDFEFKRSGNIVYLDPETTIRFHKSYDEDAFTEIERTFPLEELFSNEKLTRQTFLTDYYAVCIVILEMLLGGVVLSNVQYYDTKELRKLRLTRNHIKYINISLAYNDTIFRKVIYENLKNSFVKHSHFQVAQLLAYGLLDRQNRASGFKRDIKVYRNNQVEIEQAIDVSKVESLLFYVEHRIQVEGASSLIFPEKLLTLLKSISERKVLKRPVNLNELTIDIPGISVPTAPYTYTAEDF